jgi:putative Ca2+/H+ antiporter (TMEM165/GDT1 family)
MSQILAIFATVFLAELGDKTQLATLLFASGRETAPLTVFFAAAAALVLSTAVAVILGVAAERYLTMVPLKLIAGIGFVVLGLWTVWDHVQSAPAA